MAAGSVGADAGRRSRRRERGATGGRCRAGGGAARLPRGCLPRARRGPRRRQRPALARGAAGLRARCLGEHGAVVGLDRWPLARSASVGRRRRPLGRVPLLPAHRLLAVLARLLRPQRQRSTGHPQRAARGVGRVELDRRRRAHGGSVPRLPAPARGGPSGAAVAAGQHALGAHAWSGAGRCREGVAGARQRRAQRQGERRQAPPAPRGRASGAPRRRAHGVPARDRGHRAGAASRRRLQRASAGAVGGRGRARRGGHPQGVGGGGGAQRRARGGAGVRGAGGER